MVSFYPGPSKVYSQIPQWVRLAHQQGILGINHRSKTFMELMKDTISELHAKLFIPNDYRCFFTSSATECWEIITQSLIDKKSFHITNGAFGEKWHDYTKRLIPAACRWDFGLDEVLPVGSLPDLEKEELIAVTQNETSNGTQVGSDIFRMLRQNFPQNLIAVDATSSLGGIKLPWDNADVWFASVQKCLGLPAGMALMICSPNVYQRVKKLNADNHYNSLIRLYENMAKWQTSYTPNVLNIFLLWKVLQRIAPINQIHDETVRRFNLWMEFLSSTETLKPLVQNQDVRSFTVIAVRATSKEIGKVINECEKAGFLLGKGYGRLNETTLRIANFPALDIHEIQELQHFWTEQGY